MDPDEDDILNDVINESRDHLSNIEPDLLTLEQDGKNVSSEVVNRIFRAIHSIKGGFSFFGKENITRLSHSMENILTKVRKGVLEPTPEVIDVLLHGVDKLQVLIDDINYSDSISIEEELQALAPFVDDNAKSNSDSKKETIKSEEESKTNADGISIAELLEKLPSIKEDKLREACNKSLFIFEITLLASEDLIKTKITPAQFMEELAPIAEVIYMPEDFDKITNLKKIKKSDTYIIIVSSVIEHDLMVAALNISEDKVVSLNVIEDTVKQEGIVDHKASSPDKTGHPTKNEQKSSETLRVRVDLLNSLVNLAGELVLGRNQILQKLNTKVFDNNDLEKLMITFSESIKRIDNNISLIASNQLQGIDCAKLLNLDLNIMKDNMHKLLSLKILDIPGLNPLMQNIDHVTSGVQENIMQTRMQPIGTVLKKFPRIIRDLSKSLNKDISLELSGEDVELDKSIIELLSDPLTHLIRNSVDHGIETKIARKSSGKSEKGIVFLGAYHEGGKVVIEITDDGAGIDPEKLINKALERGLVTKEESENMSDKDKQMLIFAPGFSTAEVVSDISGRGVGMDVVRTNIESLGGSIEIDSKLGKGTSIIMKLPLTLAIIPSLLVEVGARRFAIPQVGIEELVRIRSNEITTKIQRVHGSEVLRLRDKLLPLVRLSDILKIPKTFEHPETGEVMSDRREKFSDRRLKQDEQVDSQRGGNVDRRAHLNNAVKLAVLKVGENHFGLVVDSISNSEEIVVKPLSGFLKTCQLYSGCTILGDGTVAMILDPVSLSVSANLQFEILEKEMASEALHNETGRSKVMQSMLLFNNYGNEHFGIDISKITRIEKIRADEVIIAGNKEFLKYEDYSIKLFRLHDYLPITPPAEESEFLFVFLPKGLKTPVGILAYAVEDVLNTEVVLDEENIKGPGILGSSIIRDNLTLILDFHGFLKIADPELFAEE